MAENNIKSMVGKVFNDIAEAMERGQFREKIKIGITTLGSELGLDNIIEGAELAQRRDNSIDVILIGPKIDSQLTQVIANSEEESYKKMEELLENDEIDACITMHYNFPIGTATVGKTPTPGMGREMFIATTTGTAATDRIEAMIRNGINGIVTAKAMGIHKPSIGILNLDGARQVEKAFKELNNKGYKINFVESSRVDGGAIMRGNDLLLGIPDIMITDTLTGNVLMKMLSSYTTGGSYESVGCGYGPGIGEDYDKIVLILSRASGSPVVSNAISYGADLVRGRIKEIGKEEYKKANQAGLDDIVVKIKGELQSREYEKEITAPPAETVSEIIEGIDIMELDNAVEKLWENNIYAESGMGCTGPIIMVSKEKLDKSIKVLISEGYNINDPER